MRELRLLPAILAASLLSLGACQTIEAEDTPRQANSMSLDLPAPPTHAFAQGVCGECHAVEAPWISPNPASPTFEDIANRPGLSEESLAGWLSDAHNYPEVMDVDLSSGDAEAIAAYMLTLRRSDYVRPPS